MPASIWLQPQEPQVVLLRALIAELAQRHGTVAFAPHLTVCGAEAEDTWDAAADYLARYRALPLRVGARGVSFSTTAWQRAVVIDVENTDELRRFREELQRITGAGPFQPPHISLLYAVDPATRLMPWAQDAARLGRIAEAAAHRIGDQSFALDCPIIVKPEGEWQNVPSWRTVRRFGPA